MHKLPVIAVAIAFLFSCGLFSPLAADAASHKAGTPEKAAVQKKNSKKAASAAKKQLTEKKSAKKQPVAKKPEKQPDERAVWLRRAQASEALTGKASWYGKDFHNKATASGLTYDMHTFTAAHRTLPMGTVVKVTDQNNGKSVMVCVTDRGPFIKGRIIDVSYAAARQLGLDKRGVGKVALEVVSDEHGAPLRKDQGYFVKYSSQAGKSKVGPFHAFADAAAMREALSQAHPEAEVVLEKDSRK